MKKLLIFLIVSVVLSSLGVDAKKNTTNVDLTSKAKAAVLMEAKSGQILYELDINKHLPIASVTKTMTMLLIMEAIDSGKIDFQDKVPTSEHAASMGGSQVYLEIGEQMSVNDMLKAIAVASGNDATVAMAEYISGSEEAFVELMNKRVLELGGRDTHFTNCNGLDRDENYSCAYDIALISKELLRHPRIHEYLTIWIDSLRDGKFGLANTNKLIRFYDGANGIKTGSTDLAKYCLSASAKRDNMQLIAVILGAPTTADRFAGASKLLDYGFANYSVVVMDDISQEFAKIEVSGGYESNINVELNKNFGFVVNKGKQTRIEKSVNLPNMLTAPIKKGEKVGEMSLSVDGIAIGSIDIVACSDIPRITLSKIFIKMLLNWITI